MTAPHQKKLITFHKERLYALELKLAQYGLNAPVEITTEIEQIKAAILALETVADLGSTSTSPVIEDRRNISNIEMRLNIMTATVMAVVAEVSSVKIFVQTALKDRDMKFNRILVVGIGIVIILFTILLVK